MSWADTDTTTVCGAWLCEFKGFHPKPRPAVKSWVQSPKPVARGLAHPCARSHKLQNQAAGGPTLARASASAAPLHAGRSLLSGSLRVRGEDAISATHPAGPRRVAANLLRAELARLAREPGRPRTGGPGRAGSHLPRARTLQPHPPGRPRLHPTASPRPPDTHVPGDSPL